MIEGIEVAPAARGHRASHGAGEAGWLCSAAPPNRAQGLCFTQKTDMLGIYPPTGHEAWNVALVPPGTRALEAGTAPGRSQK